MFQDMIKSQNVIRIRILSQILFKINQKRYLFVAKPQIMAALKITKRGKIKINNLIFK